MRWHRPRRRCAHGDCSGGRPRIGYSLSTEEHGPNELVEYARRAEAAGFAYAMISDHLHPWIDAQGSSPGPIGQLAAQTASALGAPRVVITDVNAARLEFAGRYGATTVDVSEDRAAVRALEADVLLECSGHPSALGDGIGALRPAGRAVCVGMGPESDAVVPLATIQQRELWLTGTFRYANTYPAAISLAASGKVDLDGLVSRHFQLDEAETALRLGRTDPAAIKAVVHPS